MSNSSQKAYSTIRTGILNGDFKAGEFVTENEFADYCGVSRTPVREAITRLVSEILLQRTETNRVLVPNWSSSGIDDLFELRAILEMYCAKRTARFITAEQLDELKTHLDFIENSIENSAGFDVSGFVEGNRRFHNTMVKAACSDHLDQMLKLVVSQVIIHQTAEHYLLEDARQSQRDHRDFIAAFEMREVEWAGAIANGHIRRAASSYRRRLIK